MLCQQRRIDATARPAEAPAVLVVAEGSVLAEISCMLLGAPIAPGLRRPGPLELTLQGESLQLHLAQSTDEAVGQVLRIKDGGGRLAVTLVADRVRGSHAGEAIGRIRALEPRALYVVLATHVDGEELASLGELFAGEADDWDLLSRPFSGALLRHKARHMVASWRRRRCHESELEAQTGATHDLAASAAHEINNPIAIIQSNLGSLSRYVAKIVRYVQEAQRGEEIVARLGDPEAQRFYQGLRQLRRELKLDFVLDDVAELVQQSLRGAARVQHVVRRMRRRSQPWTGAPFFRRVE